MPFSGLIVSIPVANSEPLTIRCRVMGAARAWPKGNSPWWLNLSWSSIHKLFRAKYLHRSADQAFFIEAFEKPHSRAEQPSIISRPAHFSGQVTPSFKGLDRDLSIVSTRLRIFQLKPLNNHAPAD